MGVKLLDLLVDKDLGPGVEMIDGGTAIFEVLSAYDGGDKLIVIDAVSGGGEPGTIYRIPLAEWGHAMGEGQALSIHEVSLEESLTLLELAGVRWEDVVLFGVEPKDVSWGEELTEPVSQALLDVATLVAREAGVTE